MERLIKILGLAPGLVRNVASSSFAPLSGVSLGGAELPCNVSILFFSPL